MSEFAYEEALRVKGLLKEKSSTGHISEKNARDFCIWLTGYIDAKEAKIMRNTFILEVVDKLASSYSDIIEVPTDDQ